MRKRVFTEAQKESRRRWQRDHQHEQSEKKRIHYREHNEEMRTKNRARYAALLERDAEGTRAANRQSYNKNKDKYLAKAKVRYQSKRAEIRALQKERRIVDPRTNMICSSRARAAKLGLPHTITKDDLFVPSFCPVLGIPLKVSDGIWGPNSPSLDRIIPELGYIPGNVMVISWRANCLKRDATVAEMKALARFYSRLLGGKNADLGKHIQESTKHGQGNFDRDRNHVRSLFEE